jgi:hypothetical protein
MNLCREGVIFTGQQLFFIFVAHGFTANVLSLCHKQSGKCIHNQLLTIEIQSKLF